MYHVRKSSPIASACLSGIRRTLAEMGAPYDIYSISDIGLPIMENYRFFIFVNQYDIPDDIMANIKKYCHKSGKTVLWLYAPDYAHGGKNDAGRISAITGMKIEESLNPHGALVLRAKKFRPIISARILPSKMSMQHPSRFTRTGRWRLPKRP